MDWLSKNGKVIGKIEKLFAHQNGLLHPAVHVFVFDSKKRLILQYRAHTKKIYPSLWDTSVGGHVRAGESLLRGAHRELTEELGLHIPVHHLGWADFEDKERGYHHHERIHYHYAILPSRTKISPNEEFEDIAFVSLKDMPAFLKKHSFTPSFLAGWKKFSKKLNVKVNGKK